MWVTNRSPSCRTCQNLPRENYCKAYRWLGRNPRWREIYSHWQCGRFQ